MFQFLFILLHFCASALSILYEKKFNGITYYLEEKRTGKQELAAVTPYKKKTATASNAPADAFSVTSKTLRGSTENIYHLQMHQSSSSSGTKTSMLTKKVSGLDGLLPKSSREIEYLL